MCGEPSGSPELALINYLRHVRACCEDDSERQIDMLDNTEHAVLLMEHRTLKSEEEREAAMIGLDDEDYMRDLNIGGTYLHQKRRIVYLTTVEQSGDEESGALTIRYKKKPRK